MAALVLSLCALVVTGWVTGRAALTSFSPGRTAMVPLTATCLALLAGVLLSTWASPRGRLPRALALAVVVLVSSAELVRPGWDAALPGPGFWAPRCRR